MLRWVRAVIQDRFFLLPLGRGQIPLRQDEAAAHLASVMGDVDQSAEIRGSPQKREDLPIGTPAPDFALPDLEGRIRTPGEFLGQSLLVVFFRPDCGFSIQMAPRLGYLPSHPRVLLISRGDPEENRHLAIQHRWRCEVVIEPDWDVLDRYQATGTPTGYLLDAEGRIASPLADGADALLSLLVGGAEKPSNSGAALNGPAEPARSAGLPIRESRLNRDGLPPGTRAPDFDLPDLTGTQRSLREFHGRWVFLVFSHTGCGPCQTLAPELVKLHPTLRKRGTELIMVGRGDPETNRVKAEEYGFTFPVFLQKHWEIQKEYAMFTTPVAYLIDDQRMIAADVAVGVEAILSLVHTVTRGRD
jgi:peroxiredoxin